MFRNILIANVSLKKVKLYKLCDNMSNTFNFKIAITTYRKYIFYFQESIEHMELHLNYFKFHLLAMYMKHSNTIL